MGRQKSMEKKNKTLVQKDVQNMVTLYIRIVQDQDGQNYQILNIYLQGQKDCAIFQRSRGTERLYSGSVNFFRWLDLLMSLQIFWEPGSYPYIGKGNNRHIIRTFNCHHVILGSLFGGNINQSWFFSKMIERNILITTRDLRL